MSPADSRDMVLVPEKLVRFLIGETDMDGRWFGDKGPVIGHSGRHHPYWWRKMLSEALSASPARGEGDAPVACRFCKGEGWEPDQNWEPRWPDVPQERQKGDGLIRCGWCLGDGTDPSPHPVPAAPAIKGVVTDEWAERFCEAVNWSPDGQECKTVEGQLRCVSFRDLAKGYILAAIATDPCAPATPEGERTPCADHQAAGYHLDPCCPHCPATPAGEELREKVLAALREIEGEAEEARQLAASLDAKGSEAKAVDPGLSPAIYAQAAKHDWLMAAVRKVSAALQPQAEGGSR